MYHQVWLPGLYFSSQFFFKKNKLTKKETHRHSRHTIHDGVSGVTQEGCHPSVPVCLVSGIGSAVREVQGVFSVFFIGEPTPFSRVEFRSPLGNPPI
jgi:hypothetical protein